MTIVPPLYLLPPPPSSTSSMGHFPISLVLAINQQRTVRSTAVSHLTAGEHLQVVCALILFLDVVCGPPCFFLCAGPELVRPAAGAPCEAADAGRVNE
jgi:hypothetical protein